jgi:hypothetical protein
MISAQGKKIPLGIDNCIGCSVSKLPNIFDMADINMTIVSAEDAGEWSSCLNVELSGHTPGVRVTSLIGTLREIDRQSGLSDLVAHWTALSAGDKITVTVFATPFWLTLRRQAIIEAVSARPTAKPRVVGFGSTILAHTGISPRSSKPMKG